MFLSAGVSRPEDSIVQLRPKYKGLPFSPKLLIRLQAGGISAGNVKAVCEFFLLAISRNIRRAIAKRSSGRPENHIVQPVSLLNFWIS